MKGSRFKLTNMNYKMGRQLVDYSWSSIFIFSIHTHRFSKHWGQGHETLTLTLNEE